MRNPKNKGYERYGTGNKYNIIVSYKKIMTGFYHVLEFDAL
jgi:hypothetical protein